MRFYSNHLLAVLLFGSLSTAGEDVDQTNFTISAGDLPGSSKLTAPGITGRVYFFQMSVDGNNWTYGNTVKLGSTGTPLVYDVISISGQRSFFRLHYTLATTYTAGATGDIDGDTLANSAELTAGTDPFNPDSDGDGMPDGWETTYGLDPLSDLNAALDSEVGGGDTLSNLTEYQLGTNPKKRDSDDDGLNDNDELNAGGNPSRFDMPILSLMEYSREATLEDWREPSYATRHTWSAVAGTYRSTFGVGVNGSKTSKPAWLNPTPWQSTGTAINANGAAIAFFDEVPGALAWGDAQPCTLG